MVFEHKTDQKAKKIINLYDKRSRQLDSIFESAEFKNTPNKDLTNIFFYLYDRRFIDTCSRKLLETCLREETFNDPQANSEPYWSHTIKKIQQKLQGRSTHP